MFISRKRLAFQILVTNDLACSVRGLSMSFLVFLSMFASNLTSWLLVHSVSRL